jgi:hypothetical protein
VALEADPAVVNRLDTFQWQYRNGAGWTAIPDATAASLSLTTAAIAALTGEPAAEVVTLHLLPFTARIYRVDLRLRVRRVRGGDVVDERESHPVPVALATAVHP